MRSMSEWQILITHRVCAHYERKKNDDSNWNGWVFIYGSSVYSGGNLQMSIITSTWTPSTPTWTPSTPMWTPSVEPLEVELPSVPDYEEEE